MLGDVLATEPALSKVWLIYGTAGLAGGLLCRWRGWFFFLVLPAALILGLPLLIELYDPQTGPAIWRASKTYYVECHAALLTALVLPLLGAWRHMADRYKPLKP